LRNTSRRADWIGSEASIGLIGCAGWNNMKVLLLNCTARCCCTSAIVSIHED
jgi:hypothetical protein